MRVYVVLVKCSPEERADNASTLDGTEGEAHNPHHILVPVVGQRDMIVRKGLRVICVELEAELLLSMLYCGEGEESD